MKKLISSVIASALIAASFTAGAKELNISSDGKNVISVFPETYNQADGYHYALFQIKMGYDSERMYLRAKVSECKKSIIPVQVKFAGSNKWEGLYISNLKDPQTIGDAYGIVLCGLQEYNKQNSV